MSQPGDQPVQWMDGLLFYFFTGSVLCLRWICSCRFCCSAVPDVDQWTKRESCTVSPYTVQESVSRLFHWRQLRTEDAFCPTSDWLIGSFLSWRFLEWSWCVCVFLDLFVCAQCMNMSCVCVSAPPWWHVLNLKDTAANPVHNRAIFISCSRTAWPMKGNYADIQPWPILPSGSADLNCHVITSPITQEQTFSAASLCFNADKHDE